MDAYDVIVVEDIDLRAMGGALHLGKNLHDNGFGMFRNMLAYKLERKGPVLVKVDKFFASTKTCHCCGMKNPDVTLGMDQWDCPNCGTHHDRDVNAALNLEQEGRRIFLEYFANWLAEDAKTRAKAEKLHNARKKKNLRNKKTLFLLAERRTKTVRNSGVRLSNYALPVGNRHVSRKRSKNEGEKVF